MSNFNERRQKTTSYLELSSQNRPVIKGDKELSLMMRLAVKAATSSRDQNLLLIARRKAVKDKLLCKEIRNPLAARMVAFKGITARNSSKFWEKTVLIIPTRYHSGIRVIHESSSFFHVLKHNLSCYAILYHAFILILLSVKVPPNRITKIEN